MDNYIEYEFLTTAKFAMYRHTDFQKTLLI